MTPLGNLTVEANDGLARPAESAGAAIAALRAELLRLGKVVVAFSGGVDSALLAWVAADTLGADALSVTAVSPSLADREHNDCQSLAAEWGLQWAEVETNEMLNAAYRVNDGNRCFHCKDALMDQLVPLAVERDATVVLGVNLDDLGDHRPGQSAAEQRGASFPLVTAGFTKELIRQVSHDLELRTADKPAAACLASRLPYGTTVSVALLSAVDRAEAGLVRLGFESLRVRHYGNTARIELPVEDLTRVIEHRAEIVDAVKAAGYEYVTVDLEGLRSGNLNSALSKDS